MQTEQFELHAEIEQFHWWFVARRRIMRTLIEAVLPPDPGTTIVDVGCGAGANLASLADAYRCVGIDTSRDAIRLASRRFPNVRFIRGLAPADLGPEAGDASMFLLMDVLEHVADDFALLSQLLAAASPGDFFLVTVPADMALWSPHDVTFGHYRRYTAERFARVWDGLPVETLLCSHFNSRLYPLIKFIRTVNRRRGRAKGQAETDFSLPSWPVNRVLQSVFAGEAKRLLTGLQRREPAPYDAGVSLVALLRRGEGPVTVRQKPGDVEQDFHDPRRAETPSEELCLT